MRKLIFIIPLVINFAFVGQNIFRASIKINKLEIEKNKMEKKNKELQEKILSYNQKLEDMKEQYYREEIARNQLQMVLPGEEIYRLVETN